MERLPEFPDYLFDPMNSRTKIDLEDAWGRFKKESPGNDSLFDLYQWAENSGYLITCEAGVKDGCD